MRKNYFEKSLCIKSRRYALIMFVALSLSPFVLVNASDVDALLETGSAAKLGLKPAIPDEIKIVSYNMRWRGGDDLNTLIKLLKEDKEIGKPSVIGLQEVDRNKTRTNGTNTAKKMAEELQMHYAWAAPPPAPGKENNEEETGVAILSPYPLTDVTRILLPNPGPGGRRRVALGATVHIGKESLRVYSVHAEVRTSNENRIGQLQAVLDDLQTNHAKVKRSVVLGDFNTLVPKDINSVSRLFTSKEFQTPFSNNDPTWRTFIIELKLDWIWLRGFDVKDYGIDKQVDMSDHWPLWAVVKLKDGKE